MVHLGQRLQNERKKRKLTLDEVAEATKIRASFLSAIEQGEYYRLPSPAYAKGFVMNYAMYLGFSQRETLALFRREFDEKRSFAVLPTGFSHKERYAQTFRITPISIAIGVVFLVLFGYLFLQYRSVFFNPPLSISQPQDNAHISQEFLVKGRTDPNSVVAVDGDIVSVGDDGSFSKTIILSPGKTKIEVTAKSRYGKTTTVDRVVTVK